MPFRAVAKIEEVESGKGICVDVDKRKIAIFNVDGQFYALDDFCPHKGAPLWNGMIYDNEVGCAWHGASFNLSTGEGTGGPCGAGVTAYSTRVNGDEIEIDF